MSKTLLEWLLSVKYEYAITDVKKYDINRRIYLPKWVEEDLG